MIEATEISKKVRKPPDFIMDLIRINRKCLKVMEFCDNNFELENERNNKIRGMMSNDLTEQGKKEGKFDVGARNLASFMDNKFKTSYSKNEGMGDTYKDLVALFKILQEKTRFIDEEHRFMSNRML